MAYTKQVREYCLKNQGAVLDVSLVKDGEFSEIPYKTLLKILNRLEEEKLIFGISKGVRKNGKECKVCWIQLFLHLLETNKDCFVRTKSIRTNKSNTAESDRTVTLGDVVIYLFFEYENAT